MPGWHIYYHLFLNENFDLFVLKTSRSAKTKCPGKSHLNVNHVSLVLSKDERENLPKNVLFRALPEKGGWVVGVDWGEGAAQITKFVVRGFFKKKSCTCCLNWGVGWGRER